MGKYKNMSAYKLVISGVIFDKRFIIFEKTNKP